MVSARIFEERRQCRIEQNHRNWQRQSDKRANRWNEVEQEREESEEESELDAEEPVDRADQETGAAGNEDHLDDVDLHATFDQLEQCRSRPRATLPLLSIQDEDQEDQNGRPVRDERREFGRNAGNDGIRGVFRKREEPPGLGIRLEAERLDGRLFYDPRLEATELGLVGARGWR